MRTGITPVILLIVFGPVDDNETVYYFILFAWQKILKSRRGPILARKQ
jgi:hypothetical protein